VTEISQWWRLPEAACHLLRLKQCSHYARHRTMSSGAAVIEHIDIMAYDMRHPHGTAICT